MKDNIAQVKIDEMKFPNIGVGYAGDRRVHVKGALIGQTVEVRLKRGRHKAQLLSVVKPADYEVPPGCDVYGLCGGCFSLCMPYDMELSMKDGMVRALLAPLIPDGLFHAPIPSPDEHRYRNKMEFSFGDNGKGSALALGMRKKGSFYEVADASGCLLCHEDYGIILSTSLNYLVSAGEGFYHRKLGTGNLRNLVIRSTGKGEMLINLVVAAYKDYGGYAKAILSTPLQHAVKGIMLTVNSSPADVVKADSCHMLYGEPMIYEDLHGLSFGISPFSFFQTNAKAAALLYARVIELCGKLENKTALDLYCGTGTIAQLLAKHGAKHVIGIEIIEEAITAAKQSAKRNNLNLDFITSDVKAAVNNPALNPDIIILDPPREGINPKAIPHIINMGAKDIIYISCKASSLLNDLPPFLDAGYKVDLAQCIDMFPKTGNVETIIKLSHTKF